MDLEHLLIHNQTMDPPTKKQCLTWQFLMRVARNEGLSWEADLAAYVSKMLSAFYSWFNVLAQDQY